MKICFKISFQIRIDVTVKTTSRVVIITFQPQTIMQNTEKLQCFTERTCRITWYLCQNFNHIMTSKTLRFFKITIRKIKQLYNPKLEICGILLTMYNGRLILTAQVVAELKKYYKDKLFSTTISRNVKLSEAPSFGMPVYYHDKYCKGATEYLDAAKELVTRI